MNSLLRRAAALGLTVGLVFAVLLLLSGGPSGSQGSVTPPSGDPAAWTPNEPAFVPAAEFTVGAGLGRADAPVTITVWADFQCPICGAWANGTEPSLYERYVRDGQVRIEHRHASFLGEESTLAAAAAICADQQNTGWAYGARLYANQAGENAGAFAPERLRRIAEVVGLDLAAYDRCVADPATTAEVERDTAEARAAGVTGTPTIVIGEWRQAGIPKSEELYAAIDAALAAQP